MNLLYEIRRLAFKKGLIGGSRPWLILGVAAWTIRAVFWALRPDPTVSSRTKLSVGETLLIRHEPAPPTRRQRRKSRKSDKRAKRKIRRQLQRA